MKIFNITGLFVMIASTLFLSCTQPVDIEKIEKEIEESNARQIKGFETKDLAVMTANYAEDAVILPQNGPMVKGKENINEMFKEMAAMMDNFSFTKTDLDASENLAYELGTYTGSFGGVPDNGKYLTVWKKQTDGKWMIAADIFNTSLPIAPSSTPEKK
jgi:ketosteroid isomerase-like protein